MVPDHRSSPYPQVRTSSLLARGLRRPSSSIFWCTDLTTNPYALPAPGGSRYFKFPVKTAEGVFNTALNPTWHTVSPLIIELFERNGIRYSFLKGVRFATYDDEMKKTLSPITLWIATQPGTTTPRQYRNIYPAILRILEENGVKGVVIEWYEAAVRELAFLMCVVDETNPTYTVRRPLTAALGLPVASHDAQGSLDFYFHVNKGRNGDSSDEVMGVTCKHVLHKDTKAHYQHASQGSSQAAEQIRVSGIQRFQQLLADNGDLIGSNLDEIIRLAIEVVRLANAPEGERDEQALGKKMHKLNEMKEESAEVEKWLKEVTVNFPDMDRRNITATGHPPPPFSTSTTTTSLWTGNLVDLGNKWTTSELNVVFWPKPAGRSGAKFASNMPHHIMGVVEKEQMTTPNDIDENGDASYTVGKNGNTTRLTTGRYNGLDAYICNEFGRKSIGACIYNWSKRLGSCSGYSDSGSLVWTREGKMLGMIHSGELKGFSNHVTYATPAW